MLEEKILLVDPYEFVASVGGGLGLFLGFSVISTLFSMFDFIFSLSSRTADNTRKGKRQTSKESDSKCVLCAQK